jgi:hypothetical protein
MRLGAGIGMFGAGFKFPVAVKALAMQELALEVPKAICLWMALGLNFRDVKDVEGRAIEEMVCLFPGEVGGDKGFLQTRGG